MLPFFLLACVQPGLDTSGPVASVVEEPTFAEVSPGRFEVAGPAFTASVDPSGAWLDVGPDAVGFTLLSWGRAGSKIPLAEAAPSQAVCLPGSPCEERVERSFDGMTEWWSATSMGLHQGWTLEGEPDGSGTLEIEVGVVGADARGEGTEALLLADSGTVLRYYGLRAWDATGRDLDASLVAEGDLIRIVIDDAGAEWPIEVDPIVSTATATLIGETTNSVYGFCVSRAGDLNGDGYPDMAVGAPYYGSNKGKFYVYYGSSSGISSTAGTTLDGTYYGPYLGYSIAPAGDVDNDGYDDLVVGAPGYSSNAGSVYLFRGTSNGLQTSCNGCIVGTTGSQFGTSVGGAGDINGDGYDDIIGGGPYYATNSGYLHVFRGYSAGLWSTALTTIYGSAGEYLGARVAVAGDLNRDGYDDVVAGLPSKGSNAGEARTYHGSATGLSNIASMTTSGSANSILGQSVAGGFDVNGDGYDDIAVGAPGWSSSNGRVTVHLGSASGVSSAAASTLNGGTLESYGQSVAFANTDGDAYDDLIVGAYGYNSNAGRVYVYRGTSGGLATTPVSTVTAGSTGMRLGNSVSGADLDNDGYADVIMGASAYNSTVGLAYVHAGYPDLDGDGYAGNGTDCNDNDASIHPGATETPGTGIDSNCDGTVVCHVDADNDNHRLTSTVPSTDGDCTDSGEAVNTDPADDCNDANGAIYPGATDTVADGIDSNCDNLETCYANADGDGYRTSSTVTANDSDCLDAGEALSSLASGDCNDASASIYPGAPDTTADGIDSNCDGVETCHANADGDAYRTSTTVASSDADCSDSGEALASMASGDCDDASASIYPGAADTLADGVDSNCDGLETCYVNADADAYRTSSTVSSTDGDCSDSGEAVASLAAGDCDDSNPAIYPGAAETAADGIDSDCNGTETCYADADGDHYRTTSTLASSDADCSDAGEALASASSGDCNDASANIYPGAADTMADGVDSNCDGVETCYVNADGDSYRTSATVASSDADCADTGEALASLAGDDCNDADANVHPNASETTGSGIDSDCDGVVTCHADGDADGYRTTSTVASADADCTDSGEALATAPSGDCNDADASVNPGATEGVADGLDSNCDGQETCYTDGDADAYRSSTTILSSDPDCADVGEAASSVAAGDCNDADAAVHPLATEGAGDAIDSDCNGAETCYADADADGYRTDSTLASADADCSDGGEALAALPAGDCNDAAADVNPSATEVCNGRDDDCDGTTDGRYSADAFTWYQDNDSDGYGTDLVTANDCDPPDGYVAQDGDCDDDDEAVNPDATEVCNNTDDDCDGTVDGPESSDAAAWYADSDGDGFGNPESSETACEQPDDHVADSTDCDDSSADVSPGATEIAGDGIDQDCDGADAADTDDTDVPDDSDTGTGGKDPACGCASGSTKNVVFGWLPGFGVLGILLRRRSRPSHR